MPWDTTVEEENPFYGNEIPLDMLTSFAAICRTTVNMSAIGFPNYAGIILSIIDIWKNYWHNGEYFSFLW